MLKFVKWAIALCGIAILVIGGYVLYEFKFKTYDVADEELDHLIEEQYEVVLPEPETEQQADGESETEKLYVEDGTVLVTKNNEVIAVQNSAGESVTHAVYKPHMTVRPTETGEKEVVTQTGEVVEKAQNKMPAEAIKAKYTASLQSLEAQAEARIDTLIHHAKAEYYDKKRNGESVSLGYFYNKYMSSSETLEASTDAAFNGLLAAVEQELEANGHSKAEAQALRTQYEQQKEQLRASLKNKALDALR